ncbi:MAG: 7TM diverse intracellular signaling domain-containing protein [Bacteroidota bacterium]
MFFILSPLRSFSQANLPLTYYDISKTRLADTITNNMEQAFLSPGSSLFQHYPDLLFFHGIDNRKKVSDENVPKTAIIRFKVCNTGDTTNGVYFFPGYYFNTINLYRVEGNTLSPLPRILPGNPDSIGYRYFTIAPKDSATIIAELKMEKTYNNVIRPRLVYSLYLPAYVMLVHNVTEDINMLTYLICGLFLMMILFSLANYFSGSNDEFLYYSLYGFMLGAMLFIKSFFYDHALEFNYFVETYLDFMMQSTGYIFYLVFMQRFIDTKIQHPFLHKLFRGGIFILIAAMLEFTWFHFFSDNFSVKNGIETFTKVSLITLLIPAVIIYGVRNRKDKMLRYIVWGNLSMFVFSIFSQALILFGKFPKTMPVLLSNSLFYYEIGLLLEFIFFLMALSFKNRRLLIEQTRERERLKSENQMKEYEKELAVFKAQQEERDRISADMHDELGSGMTAIRLMSEIAKNKMKGNVPKEIEKISESANDVLNKMNAIIWTMNSGNDTVDNLVSYIRAFSQEYFDSTDIHCKINTPEQIQHKEITGDKRRNIFLAVKETLTNALKHSQADEIIIDIEINHSLKIRIADNGVGIDMNNLRPFGNGIQNIRRRMKTIGGDIQIANQKGTITILELPLD